VGSLMLNEIVSKALGDKIKNLSTALNELTVEVAASDWVRVAHRFMRG
jgi:hypothetical protein